MTSAFMKLLILMMLFPEERKARHFVPGSCNHYVVLGLSQDATPQDIKKAYKLAALKFHPDKDKSSEATENFKRVAQAFQVLSDPEQKSVYDFDLAHGREPAEDLVPAPDPMATFRSVFGSYRVDSTDEDPNPNQPEVIPTAAAAGPEVIEPQLLPDDHLVQEVVKMQNIFNKTWPLLISRFQNGCGDGNLDPRDLLKLILEVEDFMLTPIQVQVSAARASSQGGRIPPVFIMVGATGAGKSLTANWILGNAIKKVKKMLKKPSDVGALAALPPPASALGDDQPVSDSDDDDDDDDEVEIEVEPGAVKVGHGSKSCTFAPNVIVHKDFILIDYPGLSDTNGFEIRLGMDLAFRAMLNMVKPAHVLCLIPIESFRVKRGQTALEQLSALQRLLPMAGCKLSASLEASEEFSCRWMVGVTKCDEDFVMHPKTRMNEAKALMQDWNPNFPSSHVVNMNKLIFSGDSAANRTKLVDKLRSFTKTPTKPMACLTSLMRNAFGDGVQPGCLASDCLSVADLAKFQNVLRAHKFEEIFMQKQTVGYNVKAKSWKNGSDQSWYEAQSLLKKEIQNLSRTSRRIREDSEHLKNTKQLGLEARDPVVRELCGKAQAGLKLAFVTAEDHIMQRNAADTIDLFNQFLKLVETLRDVKCLTVIHYNEVLTESKKVKKALDANVEQLGFLNATDFVARKTAVMGGVLATAGGVTLGLTIGCSTTLAGGLAGASGLAIGGIATGGVVLGIGAILGVAALGVTGRNYWWSETFKDTLVAALQELGETNEALLRHKTKLSAVQNGLGELLVPP